jgi:hypothetical protein
LLENIRKITVNHFAKWIVSVLKDRAGDDTEPMSVLASCRDLAGLLVYVFLAALAEVMERPRLKDIFPIATSWTLDDAVGFNTSWQGRSRTRIFIRKTQE